MNRKIVYAIAVLVALLFSNLQAENCLSFNGTNQSVTVPHHNSYNVSKVTMEMRFNWQSTAGTNDVDFLISKAMENLEVHTGGTMNNGLRFIPTNGVYLDTPANVMEKNVWYHVAFTYDPSVSQAKCYINGNEVTLTNHGSAQLSTPLKNTTTQINIGKRNDNSYHYQGMIDEVRIWNRVLSQSEIKNQVTTVTGSENGLIALYRMNETTGTTVTDASTAQNNGTTVNMSNSNWQTYTLPVTAMAATNITATSFTANWFSFQGSSVNNFLDLSTNSSFTALVPGYQNLNVGVNSSKEITGLSPATTYYYRLKTTGVIYSNIVMVKTAALDQQAPVVTQVTGTAAFQQSPMQINAKVTDETGVGLVEGFYRLTGQTSWTAFTMTKVDTTSSYTGTIPALNGVVTGKIKFKTTDTVTPSANTGESQEYDIAWPEEMAIGWGSMTSNIGLTQLVNPTWKMGMDYNFGTKMDLVLKRIEFAYMNYASGLTTIDIPWNIKKVTQTNATTITETGVLGSLSGTASTALVNGSGNGTVTVNNNTTLTGHVAVTLVLPKSFYIIVDQAGTNGHLYGNALSTASTMSLMTDLSGSWCVRMIVGPKGSSVDDIELLPGETELAQNYPNPFNPSTTINFFNSMSGNVKLTVMNAKGEVVSKLVDSRLAAGNHSYDFNGAGLNSGVYFYKLETPNGSLTKKMIMVK